MKIPREKVEYGFDDPKLENKDKQQWINERLPIKKPIKKDEYQSGEKINNDFSTNQSFNTKKLILECTNLR